MDDHHEPPFPIYVVIQLKQQSQLFVQFRFILLQRKLAQSVEKLCFVEDLRHHDRLQSVLQGVGQFKEVVWFHGARGEGQYVIPCVHLHHMPHLVHTHRELAVVRAVTFHLQVLHDVDLFVLEVVAAVVVQREVVENGRGELSPRTAQVVFLRGELSPNKRRIVSHSN
jgi:hypothetical protein